LLTCVRSYTSIYPMPRHCHFLLFVYLLFRSPPLSTLFPYTTLFRSGRAVRNCHACLNRTCFTAAEVSGNLGIDACRVSRGTPLEDRKSTRLNSSHQIISYAVFCLKKKKSNK